MYPEPIVLAEKLA